MQLPKALYFATHLYTQIVLSYEAVIKKFPEVDHNARTTYLQKNQQNMGIEFELHDNHTCCDIQISEQPYPHQLLKDQV